MNIEALNFNCNDIFIDEDLKEKYGLEIITLPDEKYIENKNRDMFDKSFYIFDYSKVINSIKNFQNKSNGIKGYFEVRANNDPLLLKILSIYNFGFFCFSLQEVIWVREISSNPIIIGNPALSETELKKIFTYKYRIDFILVDNLDFLELIAKYLPETKVVLHLYSESEERFGVNLPEASLILKRALDKNLNVTGVFLSLESEVSLEQINFKINVYEKLFLSRRFEMNLLLMNQKSLDVMGILKTGFEKSILLNSLLCERYITVSETISSLKIFEEKNEIIYYFKNGDMFLGNIYNGLKNKSPMLEKRNDEYICSFYGSTCDSSDIIACEIPYVKMKINDHVVFENMGFGSIVFQGSMFNGFNEKYTIFRVYNKNNQ